MPIVKAIDQRRAVVDEEDRIDNDHFPITEALKRAGMFSAYTGTAGIVYGTVAGTLYSKHPVLFASVSTLQWIGCGGVYSMIREFMIYRDPSNVAARATPFQSGVAASLTGAGLATVMQKPKSIAPAAVLWGLIGFGGQKGFSMYLNRQVDTPAKEESKTSIFDSVWSPLKRLSDDEYEFMLKEHILRVDARIAIIDEDLAKLKSEAAAENIKRP